jgi:hypothetical protein
MIPKNQILTSKNKIMKAFRLVIILICSQSLYAQKASEVLENGIRIRKGEKIFLQYENKSLKFDVSKSSEDGTNPLDFTDVVDSVIFMADKNGVNIYLLPLNPLNYTYTSDLSVIKDPVNEAPIDAFSSIIDVLDTTLNLSKTQKKAKKMKLRITEVRPIYDICKKFMLIKNNLKQIQDSLKNNQKEKIAKVFKDLKDLSFESEAVTIADLIKIQMKKNAIEKHFDQIDNVINKTKVLIEGYECDATNAYMSKQLFKLVLKDLSLAAAKRKSRFDNLQELFKLVKGVQEKTSTMRMGLKWSMKLSLVPSSLGKVSIYSLTIKASGYQLSDKDEIIKTESKEIVKKTLRIRRFQRFVPEVSIGSVFTDFDYNTYGTTSNAAGQQFVGDPTENTVNNFNVTTMINFNYFIPNSAIHPLYQIGLGLNSELPTLLTGVGIRSNLNGVKRLAVSVGFAITWVKELDKLKAGDQVLGTEDINNDLKFRYSTPKPYIGIQYNF